MHRFRCFKWHIDFSSSNGFSKLSPADHCDGHTTTPELDTKKSSSGHKSVQITNEESSSPTPSLLFKLIFNLMFFSFQFSFIFFLSVFLPRLGLSVLPWDSSHHQHPIKYHFYRRKGQDGISRFSVFLLAAD